MNIIVIEKTDYQEWSPSIAPGGVGGIVDWLALPRTRAETFRLLEKLLWDFPEAEDWVAFISWLGCWGQAGNPRYRVLVANTGEVIGDNLTRDELVRLGHELSGITTEELLDILNEAESKEDIENVWPLIRQIDFWRRGKL